VGSNPAEAVAFFQVKGRDGRVREVKGRGNERGRVGRGGRGKGKGSKAVCPMSQICGM
jgi:hypothetical protein